VAQAFVYGDSFRPQLVAIVVPDPEVRDMGHGFVSVGAGLLCARGWASGRSSLQFLCLTLT